MVRFTDSHNMPTAVDWHFKPQTKHKERSGSVVECLTRDRGVAGLSHTGVTAFCP